MFIKDSVITFAGDANSDVITEMEPKRWVKASTIQASCPKTDLEKRNISQIDVFPLDSCGFVD